MCICVALKELVKIIEHEIQIRVYICVCVYLCSGGLAGLAKELVTEFAGSFPGMDEINSFMLVMKCVGCCWLGGQCERSGVVQPHNVYYTCTDYSAVYDSESDLYFW